MISISDFFDDSSPPEFPLGLCVLYSSAPGDPGRARGRDGVRRSLGHGFQNPCDGMRNARLKREDAFSHAMIIVNSAMVSSS